MNYISIKKFLILLILLVNTLNAQGKKEKVIESEKEIKKDTLTTFKVDSNKITEIKKDLYENYTKTKNFAKKELTKDTEKQILGVGWYDSEFNIIKATVKSEPISIVVLTRNYKIGDKVEVTIGDDENPDSLLEKEKCSLITFIGHVTEENLAIMKNIFTVEGEKEYMVIYPEWLNRYKCK